MAEPTTASEYLDRGCDRDDQKDSKCAIEDYTKAIELNPTYAEAYANRGCAKEELGDIAGAIADWEKAVSLGDQEAAQWIKEVVNKIDIRGEELIRIIMNDPGLHKIIYNVECNTVERDKISAFVDKRLKSIGVTRPITVSFVSESIMKLALDALEQNEGNCYEKCQLKGSNLLLVAKKFPEKTYEELATLCGYSSIKSYIESIEEANATNIAKGEYLDDHEYIYYIYEDQLVSPDPEHAGDVYVPKRLIEDDPEFYNINDFTEVTKDCLVEDDLMEEHEADEILNQFNEPMMRIYIISLCFLDGEGLNDDECELKLQGVKLKDVFDLGGLSRWHDG